MKKKFDIEQKEVLMIKNNIVGSFKVAHVSRCAHAHVSRYWCLELFTCHSFILSTESFEHKWKLKYLILFQNFLSQNNCVSSL